MKPPLPSVQFWNGQRVFMTGHTGFKGGWMALWLRTLGAKVCGYSLPPSTDPSLFRLLHLDRQVESQIGDVRDDALLRRSFETFDPTVVVHLAAQPLVRASYADPVGTYEVNVVGTARVLEVCRASRAAAVLVVTSDKCYQNREQIWSYRETDRLGGSDPYSASKACAEIVAQSYWSSFLSAECPGCNLGTVRAGNVFGGGDWSPDRLVPDLMRDFAEGRTAVLRSPDSVRPWQHVLDPLCGYLLAIERLCHGPATPGPLAWNFGPDERSNVSVAALARLLADAWGGDAMFEAHPEAGAPHESTHLTVDSTKARQELGWHARWPLETGLRKTAEWYRAYSHGSNMLALSGRQLIEYAS